MRSRQIRRGWRAFDPIDVPRSIDCDKRERVYGQPRFVHHIRRHEVEPARSQFEAFAVACQHATALDHCVGFIGGVPMLTHMNRFRRPNERTGRVRFWIDMKNANLGRICNKIRQNFVPFKIGEILNSGAFTPAPGEATGSAA
jgi:hypothetical protein